MNKNFSEKNLDKNKESNNLDLNSPNSLKSNVDKSEMNDLNNINKKPNLKKAANSEFTNSKNNDKLLINDKLQKEYNDYKNNLRCIHPGNKLLKDNYSKLISIINSDKSHLKDPSIQESQINEITEIFNQTNYKPKYLELYPDYLHHDLLKDLEYRNSIPETKNTLKAFFIRKFFRLNNILEKVITKFNQMKNFNSEDNKVFSHNNKINIDGGMADDLNLFNIKREKKKDSKFANYINSDTKIDEVEIDDENEENNNSDYSSFELFSGYKNYKVLRLHQEIEQTLQRILRLSSPNEADYNKDFEFYLKHYKLKKLESIFLKFDQVDTHFHHSIDDIHIYFKETCYKDKLLFQLEYFKPVIKYICFKKGVDIWRNSRLYLYSTSIGMYEKKMEKLQEIINEEKEVPFVDPKLLKDYFRNKYSFYYKFKEIEEETEDEMKKIHLTYHYDRIHPPLYLSINSEVKAGIRELCEVFNIPFDISIDNGKAFSYSIDLFYPIFFEKQSSCFTFLPYEYSIRDFNQYQVENKSQSLINEQDIKLFNKPSSVLRNKYSLDDGFLVNNNEQSKIYDKINKPSKPQYIKKSHWLNNICVKAARSHSFEIMIKKLGEIGFIDSLLKYELELIDVVDLNTLNRLVDEYTSNISARVTNSIKIIHVKPERPEIANFKSLVENIVKSKAIKDEAVYHKTNKLVFKNRKDEEDPFFSKLFNEAENTQTANFNEEYAKQVDGDLLKYFIILRFLKIRDLKFSILCYLNYFRFIQKKFAIDCYKIENKSWKKTNDYSFISKCFSENWFEDAAKHNNKDKDANKTDEVKNINKVYNLNELINRELVSNFKFTNPILPSLEGFINPQNNYNEFEYKNTAFNYNMDFIKVLADENDEMPDFSQVQGIRIKDSNNNYIFYDTSISDLKDLERHLAKVGTYYIHNKESLVINTESIPNPTIDRTQVINDLYTSELEYISAKFELVSEFMNIYENTTDIIYQKKLMEIIIGIISERPEIDLENHYFIGSYHVATEVFKKKAAFFHTLVDYQKRLEQEENRNYFMLLEKTAFLYGETALDIIKHVRVDKREVEYLKERVLLKIKKKNIWNTQDNEDKEKISQLGTSASDKDELSSEELKLLIEIFEENAKDSDNLSNNDENKNKKTINNLLDKNDNEFNEELNDEKMFLKESLESFSSNEEINKDNLKLNINKPNNNEAFKNNKKENLDPKLLEKKFNKLVKFLKRVITKSLLGNYNEIESLDSQDITVNTEEFESLKEIIDTSISKSATKRNVYNINSRSNMLPFNDEFDKLHQTTLNFKVRSVLNLPNPLKEGSYKKFIEENKRVVPDLLRNLQYIKLLEGNPFKITESDPFASNIEHYESLEGIVDTYELCLEANEKTFNMFDHENSTSRKAMEICFYESLIEEWDRYKEFASGRTRGSQYEQLYFLQDTLLDNYQSIIYLMKTMFNTLSQPIENISPQILCRLNLSKVEKFQFEGDLNKFGSLYENEDNAKQMFFKKIEQLEKDNFNNPFMNTMTDENFIRENLVNVLKTYVLNEVKKEHVGLDLDNVLFNFDNKGNLLLNEVNIYSNLFEVIRSKKVLMKVVSNIIQLKDIYEFQKEEILNRQDNYINIQKKFDFENYDRMNSKDNIVDCVDDRVFKHERFFVSEFDPSIQNCAYFDNLTVNYLNILNPIELKTLIYHEYMHFLLLFTGVQHNNIIYLPFSQSFAELELLNNNKITSYHRKLNLNSIGGSKEPLDLSIHQFRMKLKSKLTLVGGELFYKINSKKMKNRNNIIEKYLSFNETQVRPLFKSSIIKKIYLRNFRLNLCASYVKDILIEVFIDSMKLQTVSAVKRLKEKASYIPEEYQIFEINDQSFLNYEPFKYSSTNKNFQFITDRKHPFVTFYLPSDIEILSLESITDNDLIYHYTHFNPFNLIENIHHPHFFEQLSQHFPRVTYNNSNSKKSDFRTYVFDQSLDYHSNVLVLLKLTTYYSLLFDFKFFELCFSQKQIELLRLKACVNKKEDFWHDKQQVLEIFKENELKSRLPLVIVEKIVQNENNYLNIRHDFIQLKEDIFMFHKDLRSLLKTLNDSDFNPRSLAQIKQLQNSNDNYNGRESKEYEDPNAPIIVQSSSNSEPKTPQEKKKEYATNTIDHMINEDTSNHLYSYMELSIDYLVKILTNVIIGSREKAILKNEMDNFEWLDYILKQLGYSSHFKDNVCEHDCHFEINKICKYSEISDMENLLFKHFDYFENCKYNLSKQVNFFKNNNLEKTYPANIITNFNFSSKYILDNNFNCFHKDVLSGIVCLDKLVYADLKSNIYKIQNNTEKYMIYLEHNRHNCSLVTLFKKKNEFLDYNINVNQNKLFYLVLLNNGLLPKNSEKFRQLLNTLQKEIYLDTIEFGFEDIKDIYESHGKTPQTNKSLNSFNPQSSSTNNKKNVMTKEALKAINYEAAKFDDEGIITKKEKEEKIIKGAKNSLDSSNNNLPEISKRKSTNGKRETSIFKKEKRGSIDKVKDSTINLNDNSIKILLDQGKENNTKSENTEQIKNFLSNFNTITLRYVKETRLKISNENYILLKNENLAMKEVFAQSKNDLNISQFRNKFSASLFKNIDDNHLTNINKMYFFFETFINKMLNSSIEVDTHSFNSAFIINRHEFEQNLAELMRDFINFNTILRRQEQYNSAIEKYGNAFSMKKLTVFLKSTKQKLIDYEDNIEKTTNAKLALNSNKLIYEMDNLYRQLKILKENIIVMEDYIQTYFHEKFYYITSKLRSEVVEIESKFHVFKNEVKNNTISKITDEYNNCLVELKNRTFFLTQQPQKIRKIKTIQDEGFVIDNNFQFIDKDKLNSSIIPNNKLSNVEYEEEDDSFFDHFYREIEIETNYNKDLNIQRQKTDKLYDQVNQLHLFYRMKIFNIQKLYDMEIDGLKQKLSSNQDLWEKLSVAEKNENILKEELAKTQKNLASNEEFIKKLQSQIRILHDKNVAIEKKLSAFAAHEIISNANQGENIKAKELYTETKAVYVYNLKNNVALMSAIEVLKKSKMPEALLVCENLETLHQKYSTEVENKRYYTNALKTIKEDINNSRTINMLKLQEADNQINQLKEENKELRSELSRLKAFNRSSDNSQRLDDSVTKLNELKLFNQGNYSGNNTNSLNKVKLSKQVNNVTGLNDMHNIDAYNIFKGSDAKAVSIGLLKNNIRDMRGVDGVYGERNQMTSLGSITSIKKETSNKGKNEVHKEEIHLKSLGKLNIENKLNK